MDSKLKQSPPTATRRNVLLGLVAGAGASAAVLSTTAEAQDKPGAKSSGPVLFKRTAETERYYKSLANK